MTGRGKVVGKERGIKKNERRGGKRREGKRRVEKKEEK